ncbi:Clavaminate synthase-like protein [Aspergillus eucalypticola CBS 122712]|uniref:Clavaminate synthase-like protein n=1 Tax=Aspergillus eucalypticola (strain CBS 122712 / IBT 29274) TaxID=1448314 RepID=A0A317VHP9_ASPEC|nr:Clavaminate synthase-like protein [Aspergillus eucalypticola CBS 122712]PWY72697.1 Clavaminate synthase-like protein [Aspergillus eucalypticola CBS 122712]
MDIKKCGLGANVPTFYDPSDIESIRASVFNNGIAFVEGCEEEALVGLARQLGQIVRPRNEETPGSGVSRIRFASDLVGKGYSSEELFFHTDRSGWDEPPRILMSTLRSQSESGGESLLVDGQNVLNALRQHDEDLYNLFTNSKHTSFRADDGTFVPRAMVDRETGIFRFRFDDGIQMSASMVVGFAKLQDIIYQHAYLVSLRPGQGYVLDNHRYLHGRASFTGSRELLRVLVRPSSPPSEKVILFDIDGTLCRSEALSIDAYYSCVSDIVGKDINHANTPVNLHGRTDLGLLHDILDYHQVARKDRVVEEFLKLHPQYLERSLSKGLPSVICPGAQELLSWLIRENESSRQSKFQLGLITGNSRPNALLKLRGAGIDTSIFDLDISSFGDSHHNRLSLFQDAFSKLQVRFGSHIRAKDVLVVGDTPLDVECAKQAGCSVVAVATGNYKMEELASLKPNVCCGQLTETKEYLLQAAF